MAIEFQENRQKLQIICEETSIIHQGIWNILILNDLISDIVLKGSSAGKESTCSSGDRSSIPGLGRSPAEGIGHPLQYSWASLVAQMVKNPPANGRAGFDLWVGKLLRRSNPMDCNLPGSSIHGIFQARVPEWVAISFSRVSSLEPGKIYTVYPWQGRLVTINTSYYTWFSSLLYWIWFFIFTPYIHICEYSLILWYKHGNFRNWIFPIYLLNKH